MKLYTIGLSCLLVLGGVALAQAAVIFDQNQNINFTVNRQRSDSGSGNRITADDFTFTQNASVNKVNVRGRFGVDFGSGVDRVSSVVVKIYADDGSSGGAPTGSPIFTETVNGTFIPTTIQGSEAPDYTLQVPLTTAFQAQANTKYWLSVQAITNNAGSTWQWDWNNDLAHPSAYSSVGSATAQFDGSIWDTQYARYWDPGDLFDPSGWIVRSYSGAFPTSIPINGTLGPRTAGEGQRLDLNFQLEGNFVTAAAVPEPGTLTLAVVVAMSAFGAVTVVRRKRVA